MTTIAAEKVGPARLVAVGKPEQPPLCGLLVDAGKLESTDVDRALRDLDALLGTYAAPATVTSGILDAGNPAFSR